MVLTEFNQQCDVVREWTIFTLPRKRSLQGLLDRLLGVETAFGSRNALRLIQRLRGSKVLGRDRGVARQGLSCQPSVGENSALRESGVNDASVDIRPVFGIATTDDDDVGRQAQIAEHAAQPNRLSGLVIDIGLDDEEIDIAAGVRLTASVGAEQDHLGVGRSCGQAASRLDDQSLVNYLHGGNRSRPLGRKDAHQRDTVRRSSPLACRRVVRHSRASQI